MKYPYFLMSFAVLSIAAISPAVKAQSPDPKETISNKSDLKDSVKGNQNEFSKLIQTLMASGLDIKYSNGFAQAAGLDRPMLAKGTVEVMDGKGYKCHVIYENEDGVNRPVCVLFIRAKKTKHEFEDQFFRIDLNGKLERVVTLKSNRDENGIAVKEGRSRTEGDIESPEIKKAFTSDMKFWVKDWLKKQQKLAKKDKAAAESAAK